MVTFPVDEMVRHKRQIRAEALRRRNGVSEGETLSRRIFERLMALPEYVDAHTILLYLDIRSEVRTRWLLPTLWSQGRRVVIPHCLVDRLRLFHLKSVEEVAPGAMCILEPRAELHDAADRQIAPGELDLIVAPGVAFDRRGGRLGYGKGYYDKLLHTVRPDAAKVAVCFDCQLFPEIPMLPHDVRMDKVVTEHEVFVMATADHSPRS